MTTTTLTAGWVVVVTGWGGRFAAPKTRGFSVPVAGDPAEVYPDETAARKAMRLLDHDEMTVLTLAAALAAGIEVAL